MTKEETQKLDEVAEAISGVKVDVAVLTNEVKHLKAAFDERRSSAVQVRVATISAAASIVVALAALLGVILGV